MKTLPPLLERDVTRLVCDFLRARGWRMVRMNVTRQRMAGGYWVQFGEQGMPDYLALYYDRDGSGAGHFWVEFKRDKGGRLSEQQRTWQERERQLGAVVVTVNDYETFREFYKDRYDRPDSPVKGQREL